MKKLALIIAIVLGMTMGASAQNGGLFGRGSRSTDYEYSSREGEGGILNLPSQHGTENDVNAPIGSGALLLIGFGAAYVLKKKKK